MHPHSTTFHGLLIEQTESGEIQRSVQQFSEDDLPAGEVTVRVDYSSLNYKDALAALGQRGIVKRLPHIPGIDAAGVVLKSADPKFAEGDAVIVSGYDLGQGHWGAWSDVIRMPAAWVVPLPSGLSLREAMVLGTAGFTAAQCVHALQQNEVTPAAGEVLVTGATGGVGSLAVQLLVKLGYAVVAVTGKTEEHQRLLELGVTRVLDRAALVDDSERPLLSATWAGGVDTVGGKMLSSLLRQTKSAGCVAACGLVGGAELEMTVYPFLLRGVRLCGVASADCPMPRRLEIWHRLANDWKIEVPPAWIREVSLWQVGDEVDRMLAGQSFGRVVVKLNR